MCVLLQPCHDRAGGVRHTLERIERSAAHTPRNRRVHAAAGGNHPLAGVHQHTAARAVAAHRVAEFRAAVAEHDTVRIADGRVDRNPVRQKPAEIRLAIERVAVADLREHAHRDAVEPAELLVPLHRPDVKQLRPARVRRVRPVDGAARQLPDRPGVHRAEAELPALRALTRTGDVFEDPRHLRRGEKRRELQPRLFAHHALRLGARQTAAELRRAVALPDDRLADRLAGPAVPDRDALALVRHGHRRDLRRVDARVLQCKARRTEDIRRDLGRVVSHPAAVADDLSVRYVAPQQE